MSTIKTKLSQDQILARIKPIITDKLNVEEEEVKYGAKFIDDLGTDSLDFVELSMEMEKEFNLQFNDEDLEKIITVQDLITVIHKMISE
jgi:acyl carrier protein